VRRALVAGCVGNLVEWYDFALYGALATGGRWRPASC
jgi:hypothetical protein